MHRKPLRILHTEASTGWGGQEIRILDESVGLRERGHEVQLAAPLAAPITEAARRRTIPVHAVPLDRRGPATLFSFARLVADFRPDVVVTHSSSDSWQAALVAKFSPARPALVRTRHLSTPVATGSLNRWLYGRAPARVVTTGESIRASLIDTLGLHPDAVVSIPTGTDMSRFRPGDRAKARARLGIEEHGPVVGIVATLRSWKGHRFLISAMDDPRLAEVRLVIVGDGPQDSLLRKQAAKSGRKIVFTGRKDDVAPWLQSFDVFALPSTGNEGVPQALMQAMACGLPVVTTPVGSIPELARDGDTALLVPPEDPAALAGAIARLLSDNSLGQRLAAAGHKEVAARYTATAMLDAMEEVLQKAASDRR